MAWKVLTVDLPTVPRILVNYKFDTSGYQVKLTDLSRIWSNALSKDEIVQRASDFGSSIDPSQDDEQFKILLSKIESALNCEDGTSLSLTKDRGDDSSLRLHLTAPLPRPLPRFQWSIQLSQQPQEHIESELVTPLVLRSSNLERQIRLLIDELHDKDRVISKICDRLETSGNDLTTVFPGVSNIKTSRKKSQREQLAKHVKGLEDFDEAAFKQRNSTTNLDGEAATQVVNDVFRDLPSTVAVAQGSGDWWRGLDYGSQVSLAPPKRDEGSDAYHSSSALPRNLVDSHHEEGSFQSDDFQRQRTPPHLKAISPTNESTHNLKASKDVEIHTAEAQPKTEQPLEDESTTDEDDDLDVASRKVTPKQSKPIPATKEVSPSHKKLGAIGGKLSQPTVENTANEEATATRERFKLGAIGGKAKVPVNVHEEKDEASPSPNSLSPGKSKMGVIGGKTATQAASPSPVTPSVIFPEPRDETETTRTSPQSNEKKLSPPVDPEERADKKRDQLKRELEEKAKAPVKKKRKF